MLIDHESSIFTLNDIWDLANTTESRLKGRAKQMVPKLSTNIRSQQVYEALRRRLLEKSEPAVLVIGGGDGGIGVEHLVDARIFVVNTDVRIVPGVDYAVDAHSLPFPDGIFDLVIAQAVLEHVVDPTRCVSEIHRVLSPSGLVFAETPFMQQVHLGKYDFTRFTQLGHRRLFRNFRELESGQVASAGTALAWSLTSFLTSFTSSRRSHQALTLCGRILFGWLKYLDPVLVRRTGSWDAASAFYFLGRRSEEPLPDAELIAGYRGLR